VRRILANLLCEDDLARAFGSSRPGRTSFPRSVVETVSRLGTQLRVFARQGDSLWTPSPVDPDIVPGVVLESGPLHELPPVDEVLAWCETPDAMAHRGGARDPAEISWDAPLAEILWQLPTPDPAVVARVHHRAFHLHVAETIGCALPGTRIVESFSDLDRTLRGFSRSWVVKAPFSASGRDRYIARDGSALSDPKARRTVERLFARHGALLFEPWMDRTGDFGVSALLTGSELRIVGIHGQQVDARGQFIRIDLAPDLSAEDRDRLLETVEAVADALRRAGYVGPFGIDAWRHREDDGTVVLNPLGEINARMTFGLVEWAWKGAQHAAPLPRP
jgi:hypothetical protein